MKLLNLKEEIKEILEELENMYEISELEEQVNNINKIRDYIINLQQENKQLKEQLLAAQTNEETFRLEMEDITKILGLDENTLFDDVKEYVRSLKDNWNKLKEDLINDINYWHEQEKEWIKLGFIKFGGEANTKIIFKKVLDKMQELEQGSDK